MVNLSCSHTARSGARCGAAQARRYLGPEDATQAALLFSAQTDAAAAAAGRQGPPGAPLLPPGLLVDGLPAAVLSRCQARCLSG